MWVGDGLPQQITTHSLTYWPLQSSRQTLIDSYDLKKDPVLLAYAKANPERIPPDDAGRHLLAEAAERMGLTARGYHRVLRVARTLADLEGSEGVRRIHVAEALAYRETVAGRLGAAA